MTNLKKILSLYDYLCLFSMSLRKEIFNNKNTF